MMWIAAIADEVVDVLSVSLFSFFWHSLGAFMCANCRLLTCHVKTLGEILGLSDAIIGLTSKFSLRLMLFNIQSMLMTS